MYVVCVCECVCECEQQQRIRKHCGRNRPNSRSVVLVILLCHYRRLRLRCLRPRPRRAPLPKPRKMALLSFFQPSNEANAMHDRYTGCSSKFCHLSKDTRLLQVKSFPSIPHHLGVWWGTPCTRECYNHHHHSLHVGLLLISVCRLYIVLILLCKAWYQNLFGLKNYPDAHYLCSVRKKGG